MAACPAAQLRCGTPVTPAPGIAHWRGPSGETLLHVAAAHGRADDCYRLVIWGVDAAAVDQFGQYPSDVATVPWIRTYLCATRRRDGYAEWTVL